MYNSRESDFNKECYSTRNSLSWILCYSESETMMVLSQLFIHKKRNDLLFILVRRVVD